MSSGRRSEFVHCFQYKKLNWLLLQKSPRESRSYQCFFRATRNIREMVRWNKKKKNTSKSTSVWAILFNLNLLILSREAGRQGTNGWKDRAKQTKSEASALTLGSRKGSGVRWVSARWAERGREIVNVQMQKMTLYTMSPCCCCCTVACLSEKKGQSKIIMALWQNFRKTESFLSRLCLFQKT